jgi:hypothetical protein
MKSPVQRELQREYIRRDYLKQLSVLSEDSKIKYLGCRQPWQRLSIPSIGREVMDSRPPTLERVLATKFLT